MSFVIEKPVYDWLIHLGRGLSVDPIVVMKYGAHLYGTETEDSDIDYRGIFMPSLKMLCLNKVPKVLRWTSGDDTTKNSPNDIDAELYSIQHFISLACAGETVALDMLHVNKENLFQSSHVWDEIVRERSRFYTKSLKAFVGYAQRQAAKYGIKGSRIDAMDQMLEIIDAAWDGVSDDTLALVWNRLPTHEHADFIENAPNGIEQYKLCGRIFQKTMKLRFAREVTTTIRGKYGERARKAQENEGIDWKAISHAVRAALEVKELLSTGSISFPLKDARFVRRIKSGKADFLTEAQPLLEQLIMEVEALSFESSYPDKCDNKYWEDFVVRVVSERFANVRQGVESV